MKFSDVLAAMDSIVTLGVGVMIGAGIAYITLRFFVSSYLSEKGKNLATVEDIEKIINLIEGVKGKYSKQLLSLSHQNTMLVEELRGRSQLRTAVAERRLAAHQEAFILWQEMISTLHEPESRDTVVKCCNWWVKNCLYLGPESRVAFSKAYMAANIHESLKQDHSNPEAAKANLAEIRSVGNIIISEVELPPMGEAGIDLLLNKGPS